jgi:small GTP-binding protein
MRSTNAVMLSELTPSKLEYKIAVIGDEGTGKSSLVDRFTTDKYAPEYRKTTGVRFRKKEIARGDDLPPLKFNIQDIGGDKTLASSLPGYLYEVDAVIIVWDVTRRETLLRARELFELAKKEAPTTQCKFIFVANKTDLVDARDVSQQEGSDFARECGATYVETSASGNDNIAEVFTAVYTRLLAARTMSKRLIVLPKPKLQAKQLQEEVKNALKALENQIRTCEIGALDPIQGDASPAEIQSANIFKLLVLAARNLLSSAQFALMDKQVTAQNANEFCLFLNRVREVLEAYNSMKNAGANLAQAEQHFINKFYAFADDIHHVIGARTPWKIGIGATLCFLGIALMAAAVVLTLMTLQVIPVLPLITCLVGFAFIEYAGAALGGAIMLGIGSVLWHQGRERGVALEAHHLEATLKKDLKVKILLEEPAARGQVFVH